MEKIKKTIDNILNASKKTFIGLILLASASSCSGYNIYINGVKIDERRDYTIPVILVGIATLGGAAALYEQDRQRKAEHERDHRITPPAFEYDPGTGGPSQQ